VDAIGYGFEETLQELPGRLPVRFLDQLGHREFAGSVNGHKEKELALCSSQFGNVDVQNPMV
jgi:hypothetical protein